MKICKKKKVADKNTVNKVLCLLWNAVLKLGKDNEIIQVHCKIFIYKGTQNFLVMHEVR